MAVTRRVGYDPFRENAAIGIAVRLGGSNRTITGQIEWRSAEGAPLGERQFVAKDGNCPKLLAEMSFAVALQIQLLRSDAPTGDASESPMPPPVASAASARKPIPDDAVPPDTPAQQPSPSAQQPSPSAQQPSATQAPSAPASHSPLAPRATSPEPSPVFRSTLSHASGKATPTSTRQSFYVGLGPSLALGIAPSVTESLRVFLAARRDDLSVEVSADASYPSTDRKWDGTGFRAQLISAGTAFCAYRQALSACLLGKVGQIRATGLGVDQPRTSAGLIGQTGARFAATLELGGPWFVIGHIDALGLLTPCAVSLNQVAVWEVPRFSALAGIDLAARFQ